jgi:acetate kinase
LKILVINSGSSSLKYTLFEMENEMVLFSGSFDRIGLEGSLHVYQAAQGQEVEKTVHIPDHGHALDEMLATLTAHAMESLDAIPAVAHRVGHGGKYWDTVRVDADVMSEIRRMTPMIPIHHPAMIKEIEECEKRMPHAAHVVVFDTWFHKTIPLEAAIYGLPYRYYEERGYRRTGFHGNSHAYISAQAAEFVGEPLERLKIISCHLGNGSSICAIDGGKSVDTTLGMTSVEGLIMGTRSGDVDPGLLPVIMKEDSLSPDDMLHMLYRQSGLAGLSGVSPDLREVEAAAEQGNSRANLAVNAFYHKVKRAIGGMLMVLGGCDALLFAGGIGRNSSTVRSRVLEDAAGLGFALDETKNTGPEKPTLENPVVDISAPSSRARILVISTFEELMMARQCLLTLEKGR